MIKHAVILIYLLCFLFEMNAQNNFQNTFDGKTFEIDNYIGNKFLNTRDLSFSNLHVEESENDDLGINKTAYKITQIHDNLYGFSCTMMSPEYGKMVWFGTKNGNQISGDCLLAKNGEKPIHYTFIGKMK
ncbi:MAG: hypothetical protein JKY48_04745 [Flavobacteriales bacterium]|nr:hypothetical protein [Flavobacteriales bacterium]